MTVKRKWIIAAIALLLMPASAYTYNLLSPLRHWTSDPVICVKTPGHVSISDSDGGVTKTIKSLNNNAGWNGAVAGRVLTAVSTDDSPCSN